MMIQWCYDAMIMMRYKSVLPAVLSGVCWGPHHIILFPTFISHSIWYEWCLDCGLSRDVCRDAFSPCRTRLRYPVLLALYAECSCFHRRAIGWITCKFTCTFAAPYSYTAVLLRDACNTLCCTAYYAECVRRRIVWAMSRLTRKRSRRWLGGTPAKLECATSPSSLTRSDNKR